jgi:cell division protein FtsI/penicillin-binding protein 2
VAQTYLAAWADRRYEALPTLTNDSATDIAGVYRRLDERLQVERIRTIPGAFDPVTGSLPYRAVLTLRGAGDLSLTNRLTIVDSPAGPRVAFTAATVFPGLQRGERVDRVDVVARGRLLDRRGVPLRGLSPDLDANVLGKVDNGRGSNGLERLLDTALTGGTVPAVVVVNATTGATVRQVKQFANGGAAGEDATTTLDARIQRAASGALAGAPGVSALVAIDARTGGILAVANKPTTGFPPAIAGSYAPGSTFKIATALAALTNGLAPGSRVDCPETVNAGGKTFRNHEPGSRGAITLQQAFAQSCNTAFINVASQLPKGSITAAAEMLGFNAGPPLPIRSNGGTLPPPVDAAEAAADAIGQGRVEASPLAMAAVAAAVADGTWRQPHLAACDDCTSRVLPPAAVSGLRAMMRAVVTSGTGSALIGVVGQPAAKTGTAEYGAASPPATHAWIVGYRGTLAFAVYVATGVSGGRTAGPVARRFLAALPAA